MRKCPRGSAHADALQQSGKGREKPKGGGTGILCRAQEARARQGNTSRFQGQLRLGGSANSRGEPRGAPHQRGDRNRARERHEPCEHPEQGFLQRGRTNPPFSFPLALFFTHAGVTNASPEGILIGNPWYRNLFKIFINSTCVQPRIQKRGEGRGVTDQTPEPQGEEGRGGRRCCRLPPQPVRIGPRVRDMKGPRQRGRSRGRGRARSAGPRCGQRERRMRL